MRFRIRALVLLVLFLGMVFAVGALTVENRRLRLVIEQERAWSASKVVTFYDFVLANQTTTGAIGAKTTVKAAAGAAPMPNGPDVFAGRRP
jgi:hypothetical protein